MSQPLNQGETLTVSVFGDNEQFKVLSLEVNEGSDLSLKKVVGKNT